MLSVEIEPEGSLILDVSVGCSGNEVGAHQVWAERGVIPRGGLSSVPKIVHQSVGVEPLHTQLSCLSTQGTFCHAICTKKTHADPRKIFRVNRPRSDDSSDLVLTGKSAKL